MSNQSYQNVLAPYGIWSNTLQYIPQPIYGAVANTLLYYACPSVTYGGAVYYANGFTSAGNPLNPTIGITPDSDPAWQLYASGSPGSGITTITTPDGHSNSAVIENLLNGSGTQITSDGAGNITISAVNQISGTSITALPTYSATYQANNTQTFGLAKANSPTTANCIGIVSQGTSTPSTSVKIQLSGTIINPAWSWIPGNIIYISPTVAGGLTQTVPTVGQYSVQAGKAVSPTEMLISIIYNGLIS